MTVSEAEQVNVLKYTELIKELFQLLFLIIELMQGDLLLQEWKQAKEICNKIIQICKQIHLGKGNVEGVRLAPGQKPTKKQFINVYDVVYRLCLTTQRAEHRVPMVYKDFKQILKNCLFTMSPIIMEEKDIYRLKALRKVWETYEDIQNRMNHMFAYLNRPYHLKNDKIDDLGKTSNFIFIEALFTQNLVVEYEILYFKQIDKIRKSNDFSHENILADLTDIFYQVHLKILKHMTNKKTRTIFTEFYSHYQKNAREYYIRRYRLMKQLSPSQYYIEVNNLFNQQKRLAQTCFRVTSDTLFNRQFSDEFILSYKQTLLRSELGFKYIIKQKQIDVIKIIVEIYIKLNKNLDEFKGQFQQFVFEQMHNFIEEHKAQLTFDKKIGAKCKFVQNIIRKNEQLIVIIELLVTLGDFAVYYKNGIQRAFAQIKLSETIEELIAIYIEYKFRNEFKQNEYEREIKNILFIFNCLQNKDVFLMKYAQKFVKRILIISDYSLRNHQIFIANIKMNCGSKYTQRIETIITQYRNSTQDEPILNEITASNKLKISFNIKVFSQGAWPIQNILQIPLQIFPKEIQDANQCLKIFQNQHYSKKSLKISMLECKFRWIYYLNPQINNGVQTCYFQTNGLQAALLYYVYRNRPQKVPFEFLQKFIQKAKSKLIMENLKKMYSSQQNILLCHEEGQQFLFSFNTDMKSTKKIIPYYQGSYNQQQKLFQSFDISKDRQVVLDANICKLMKAKKVLDFKSILEETGKLIKVFSPEIKDIKIAIDRLINKQILQRDQKDRQLIRYRS